MTPEELRALAECRLAWFAAWSSTAPADRGATEAAIADLYRGVGLAAPRFWWVDSPADACHKSQELRRHLRLTVWSAVKGPWNHLRGYSRSGSGEEIRRRFLLDSHLSVFGTPSMPPDPLGLHFHYRERMEAEEVSDVATAEFAENVLRRMPWQPHDNLAACATIARNVWYWWPFKGLCLVCERPRTVALDDPATTRLHSLTGPAVEFRDGWSVYAMRGVVIPREWILEREQLAVETALTWPNIEQRRIAAELIGWAKVIAGLDAQVVDENPNQQIGTLLRVNLPDAPGSLFLRVQCGTGRGFVIEVPSDMRTALQANAWTYNVTEEYILKMEVRT